MWPTPEEKDLLFYVEKHGTLPINKTWKYGDPHPDIEKFPKHKLVYVSPETEDNWSRWYYAAERVLEDEYNWQFTDADIGGTRFKAVSREYLILRSDFDPLVPAMGAALPNTPRDLFTETYVLAERNQIRTPDKELDSLFVFERRVYVKKTTIKGVLVDEFSNESHAVSLDLYYRGEVVTGATKIETLFDTPTNAFWNAYSATAGGKTTFYRREGRQISDNWFSVETVPIISGDRNDDGSLTAQDYYTTVRYTWPGVLQDIELVTWNKRAGGSWIIGVPKYTKFRYSGPCKARVVTKWKATKWAEADIGPDVPPLPVPISFATPYFSISVPACLHPAINYSWTNGTEDDVFEFTAANLVQPATNRTTWESFILEDTQEPSKGGYLRRTITIFPPDTA